MPGRPRVLVADRANFLKDGVFLHGSMDINSAGVAITGQRKPISRFKATLLDPSDRKAVVDVPAIPCEQKIGSSANRVHGAEDRQPGGEGQPLGRLTKAARTGRRREWRDSTDMQRAAGGGVTKRTE